MFHGSRNETLEFFPGICFTDSYISAATYGPHVHMVDIDRSKLRIKSIEMTEEQLREAIDDQEWPCDRDADIAATIAEGYDAVAYEDCDERGQTHDCLRLLTVEAFDAVGFPVLG